MMGLSTSTFNFLLGFGAIALVLWIGVNIWIWELIVKREINAAKKAAKSAAKENDDEQQ